MNKTSREIGLAAVGTTAQMAIGCHAHAGVGMRDRPLPTTHAHGKRGHGTHVIVLALGIALLAGCSSGESTRPAAPAQSAQVAPPPPPPPSEPKAPETVLKKAEKGVGEKGHYDSNAVVTVIATPIASYFAMRERIAFDIQLPEAIKLFKASEGRAPKSHEEFMERIIKEQHINLPTLPEGHRYVYDPKTEQLMVEQPAPK